MKIKNLVLAMLTIATLSVSSSVIAKADTPSSVDPCLRKGLSAILEKVTAKSLSFNVTDVYYNDEGDSNGGYVVLVAIKDTSTSSQKGFLGEADMNKNCSAVLSVDLQAE